MYNFFDPVDAGDSVAQFCQVKPEFCVAFLELTADLDTSVDNL
jgi:hypothetical protein